MLVPASRILAVCPRTGLLLLQIVHLPQKRTRFLEGVVGAKDVKHSSLLELIIVKRVRGTQCHHMSFLLINSDIHC